MFINIMHKTFITENPCNFSYITQDFFNIHQTENWKENIFEHIDFEEYLKDLTSSTRQYNVYPIEDMNNFLKEYCHLLGLTYDEYRDIINYNIFSLRHAEDTYGFPNAIIHPESKDWYGHNNESKVKRNFKLFPAEFAINHLDAQWAQEKFHYFRICDIINEIRNYQRKEYEEFGIISEAFHFLKSDIMTSKQLFDKDCYKKVRNTFKQRNYNTDLFDMSIKEYVNNPDCKFGYNNVNYYKFNTRLARKLQARGYKIANK